MCKMIRITLLTLAFSVVLMAQNVGDKRKITGIIKGFCEPNVAIVYIPYNPAIIIKGPPISGSVKPRGPIKEEWLFVRGIKTDKKKIGLMYRFNAVNPYIYNYRGFKAYIYEIDGKMKITSKQCEYYE